MESPIVGNTRLRRQTIPRLTDSSGYPVEALSYEPLWTGIDFNIFDDAHQGMRDDKATTERLRNVMINLGKS